MSWAGGRTAPSAREREAGGRAEEAARSPSNWQRRHRVNRKLVLPSHTLVLTRVTATPAHYRRCSNVQRQKKKKRSPLPIFSTPRAERRAAAQQLPARDITHQLHSIEHGIRSIEMLANVAVDQHRAPGPLGGVVFSCFLLRLSAERARPGQHLDVRPRDWVLRTICDGVADVLKRGARSADRHGARPSLATSTRTLLPSPPLSGRSLARARARAAAAIAAAHNARGSGFPSLQRRLDLRCVDAGRDGVLRWANGAPRAIAVARRLGGCLLWAFLCDVCLLRCHRCVAWSASERGRAIGTRCENRLPERRSIQRVGPRGGCGRKGRAVTLGLGVRRERLLRFCGFAFAARAARTLVRRVLRTLWTRASSLIIRGLGLCAFASPPARSCGVLA